MHRAVRGASAALLAAVVIGAVDVAEAKPTKQSAARYAKTVCGAYSRLARDFKRYADGIGTLDPTRAADYRAEAAAKTDTLLAAVKADEATLQGVYPNIAHGKRAGARLASHATEIDAAVTAARQQLQSDNAAAVARFQTAIQTLGSRISDPFSKLKDQHLIVAFQKERSCKDIVQVLVS
jgi:hypothetical protein